MTQNLSNPFSFTQGSIVGVKNAILGAVLFSIIDTISLELRNGIQNFIEFVLTLVMGFGFISVIGIIFSFLPSFLGGGILTIIAQRQFPSTRLKNYMVVMGAILGLLTGIVICVVVYFLAYYEASIAHGGLGLVQGKPVIDGYFYRAGSATILAMIAGGLTGKQIAHSLQKSLLS